MLVNNQVHKPESRPDWSPFNPFDFLKMHVHNILFRAVARSISDQTTNPLKSKPLFNTQANSFSQINNLLPTFSHVDPPRRLYNFLNFLPVITASRHTFAHTTPVPNGVIPTLEELHAAYIFRGAVRHDLIVDVKEIWPALWERYPDSDERRFFMRLDESSPKDSPLIPGPVTSAEEVVLKIISSRRAMEALRVLEAGQMESVILMPWDDGMDPGREFRCFVPPSSGQGRVTAISQYRWHEPFSGWDRVDAERLVEQAAEILGMIERHGEKTGFIEDLRKFGFTFDVAAVGDEVQLIEVNPFGAMSGCGSCLFHWLDDAKLLYGLEDDVEVRIAEVEGVVEE